MCLLYAGTPWDPQRGVKKEGAWVRRWRRDQLESGVWSGRLGCLIMSRSRTAFAKGSIGGEKDSGGDGRGAVHELGQHR